MCGGVCGVKQILELKNVGGRTQFSKIWQLPLSGTSSGKIAKRGRRHLGRGGSLCSKLPVTLYRVGWFLVHGSFINPRQSCNLSAMPSKEILGGRTGISRRGMRDWYVPIGKGSSAGRQKLKENSRSAEVKGSEKGKIMTAICGISRLSGWGVSRVLPQESRAKVKLRNPHSTKRSRG